MKTDAVDILLAEPGSKLAQDVRKSDNTLLIPAGVTLSTESIKLLRQLNIKSVTVYTDKKTGSTANKNEGIGSSENLQEQVCTIIAARFGKFDSADEHVSMTFKLAVEREYKKQLSKHAASTVGSITAPPAFQTQKPGPVQMKDLIAASNNLGTLPVIFHKLVAIINSPYASATDAANIIATDPALSVKLLRLVNSAFYGLTAKIDSISRAVALIGTGQLVMLAMGTTLVTAFKGLPVSLINMQSFWNHSLACGVAAKYLAKDAKLPKSDTFFVTGLLHDIGRLVFFHLIPSHAFYMMTEARRRNVPLRDMEKEVLGFSHEEFSVELLREWECPEELTNPILNHHKKLTATTSAENTVLPIANFLVQALGYGSSGDPMVCFVETAAWGKLNILASQLPFIAKTLEEQVRDIQMLISDGKED